MSRPFTRYHQLLCSTASVNSGGGMWRLVSSRAPRGDCGKLVNEVLGTQLTTLRVLSDAYRSEA